MYNTRIEAKMTNNNTVVEYSLFRDELNQPLIGVVWEDTKTNHWSARVGSSTERLPGTEGYLIDLVKRSFE